MDVSGLTDITVTCSVASFVAMFVRQIYAATRSVCVQVMTLTVYDRGRPTLYSSALVSVTLCEDVRHCPVPHSSTSLGEDVRHCPVQHSSTSLCEDVHHCPVPHSSTSLCEDVRHCPVQHSSTSLCEDVHHCPVPHSSKSHSVRASTTVQFSTRQRHCD